MIRVQGYLGEPGLKMICDAAAADLVVGGARHLDALDVPEERRVVLGAMSKAIPQIIAAGPDANVMVVASGDPGLFGIVRRMRAAGLELTVMPRSSSIAQSFSRIGMPWDDAEVVSTHGRPLSPALAACRACGKVAVMTSPTHGLRELAAGLADLERRLVLCERLGEDDERVREFDVRTALDVEEILEPNVVLVIDPEAPSEVGWRLGSPRPCDPVPEVSPEAAQLFCRMLPALGDLLWVQGQLGREVASLARLQRAAVIDLDEQPRPVAAPTWVVAETLDDEQLAALAELDPTHIIRPEGAERTA
ncbi:precorrin-6y C5,15-methyltransferase (decarboxylating) subunit CbiE [Luteococcus sp. H138]|uniref:precorrin-6y C5,15-methyltransferase (decarboxylating) subunit CbiE n=1 Tax=unclassified Luteococcus TaxID=2639923 RepID=UPI00313F2B34